jgi:hypothetical protein
MESKLQQAIIATRAGYMETAQLLLTDVLQENPKQTEAWFLLAHLVESPDRQARYLEYALTLDPDHELARQHLQRLRTPEVPPPVIKDKARRGTSSPHPTPPPEVDSEFSPIPPARTNPVVSAPRVSEASTTGSQAASQPVVVEQKSSRIDPDWQRTAGKPKRASQTAVSVPKAQPTTPAPAPTTVKRQPVNKWLLVVLVILVAVAVFVMSFLAYTIFVR